MTQLRILKITQLVAMKLVSEVQFKVIILAKVLRWVVIMVAIITIIIMVVEIRLVS